LLKKRYIDILQLHRPNQANSLTQHHGRTAFT